MDSLSAVCGLVILLLLLSLCVVMLGRIFLFYSKGCWAGCVHHVACMGKSGYGGREGRERRLPGVSYDRCR